jgi:predicted transcriptional regulator
MNLIALIEKLINGSTILKEQLEFLRDQISALEKENGALKSEIAILKHKQNENEPQFNKAIKEMERLNQVIEEPKKDDRKSHLDAVTEKVLKLFFDKSRDMSINEVAGALSLDISTAQYHFDLLSEAKLIIQTTTGDKSSWTRESTPALFELSYSGRKYVIENILK